MDNFLPERRRSFLLLSPPLSVFSTLDAPFSLEQFFIKASPDCSAGATSYIKLIQFLVHTTPMNLYSSEKISILVVVTKTMKIYVIISYDIHFFAKYYGDMQSWQAEMHIRTSNAQEECHI